MKRYTTNELIEMADRAIIAIEKELKPKAEEYFAGTKTTEFFKTRITALKSIRKELEGEPRFVVHLLGSAQNGKSTLINVLIGKKILTEGHVGACSAAVVRCRYNPESDYRMTVRYVGRESFLKSLEESIKEAGTAWGGEDPPEKRGEELRKALGRFVGFFDLGELSPPEILKTCQKFLEFPKSIEFQQFGQTIEVPVSEQEQVDEHLAARGRKAFVVDECVLEGPFPDWPPQLELVDMPGTNDVDAFRTEVTEATKTKVSGLMLVTKGTLLGGDIIRWFKDTSIMEEIADSTERNQQRLMVVRTVVDEQELEDLPETAESEWPYLERHCRRQEAQYRAQLHQVVREKFVESKTCDRVSQFVEKLPVHFVSAKTFRNLTDDAVRNRVINNPNTPANRGILTRFHRFDMNPEKTGIPKLRKTMQAATQEFLDQHFLVRLQSHLEKEVDGVVEFFRRQRLGAELQLAGKAEAYRIVASHVETKVTGLLNTTEGSQRLLGQIEAEFHQKATEILTRVQSGYRTCLEPRLELWSVLNWRTLRAVGYKGGRHVNYEGKEYNVPGDMSEIYCQQLRATWIEDRDRLIELICGSHLTELVHGIEKIVEEARGFALAQDSDTGKLVEERMGNFGAKARTELAALRADFRKQTENYESLRQVLSPQIKKILLPTFGLIGEECGTGCSRRMRQHLTAGVSAALPAIHEVVKNEVLSNWQKFILEACQSADKFVDFIKVWLDGAKELPVVGNLTANLEHSRVHAEALAEQAELLLKNAESQKQKP
jgi:hypothetical protein